MVESLTQRNLAVTSGYKRFANFTTIPDTHIGAALRKIMSRYIKTDIGVVAGADFAILAENKIFDAVGTGPESHIGAITRAVVARYIQTHSVLIELYSSILHFLHSNQGITTHFKCEMAVRMLEIM